MTEMTERQDVAPPTKPDRERLPDADRELIANTVEAFKAARESGELERKSPEELEGIVVAILEKLRRALDAKFRFDWKEILEGRMLLSRDKELLALADTYEVVRANYLQVVWRLMWADVDVVMSVQKKAAEMDMSVEDALWVEATAVRDELCPPVETIVRDLQEHASPSHDALVRYQRTINFDLYWFGGIRERAPWPH